MKKKILMFFLVLVFASVSFQVQANQLTHSIGTTGYMIQEAMWAKANKYDAANYKEALRLQSEAKDYMRGTHKAGRNVEKSLQATLQAYELAKTARDNALQITGQVVSR